VIQRIVKNASMKSRDDDIFNLKLGIRLYITVLKNRVFSMAKEQKKVHHHIHNSLPTVPVLSQLNPIHTPQTISQRSILNISSHLHLGLPSGLFPLGFPTKTLYTFLSSPVRATCPAHLICFT
jgi:hypothetical protein